MVRKLYVLVRTAIYLFIVIGCLYVATSIRVLSANSSTNELVELRSNKDDQSKNVKHKVAITATPTPTPIESQVVCGEVDFSTASDRKSFYLVLFRCAEEGLQRYDEPIYLEPGYQRANPGLYQITGGNIIPLQPTKNSAEHGNISHMLAGTVTFSSIESCSVCGLGPAVTPTPNIGAELGISELEINPTVPKAFSPFSLTFTIGNARNVQAFEPVSGHYRVEILFSFSLNEKISLYFDSEDVESAKRLSLKTLPSLSAGEQTKLTISDLYFPTATEGSIEISLISKDLESDEHENRLLSRFKIDGLPVLQGIQCKGAINFTMDFLASGGIGSSTNRLVGAVGKTATDPKALFTSMILDASPELATCMSNHDDILMALPECSAEHLYPVKAVIEEKVPNAHINLFDKIAFFFETAGGGIGDTMACFNFLLGFMANDEPLPKSTIGATETPNAIVITQRLNVRSDPEINQNRITSVVQGDNITIVGRNNACSWLQIILPTEPNKTGWVSRYGANGQELVRLNISCDDITVTEIVSTPLAAQPLPVPTPIPPTSQPAPVAQPQPASAGKVLFDDDPRTNRYKDNNTFCSGFSSDCDFGNCAVSSKLVGGPYCREGDYPYIRPGQYRITLLGIGNVSAGATDYGPAKDTFSFGRYDTALPITFTFCWPGRAENGYGFETMAIARSQDATVNRITVEYLGENCTDSSLVSAPVNAEPIPTPESPPTASAPGGPNISFNADRTSFNAGECTTLRWNVENVQAVYLNGEGVAGNDSRSVCPGSTNTYKLTIQTGSESLERSLTITVNQPAGAQIDFRADRTELNAGECTTLRWDVDNVQAVYMDGTGVIGHSGGQICPTTTRTYQLIVIRQDGVQEERTVTVQVNTTSDLHTPQASVSESHIGCPSSETECPDLFVYTGPGMDYPEVGRYPRGTSVFIFGKFHRDPTFWIKIETLDGTQGWIQSFLVTDNPFSIPDIDAPPTPIPTPSS